MDEEETTSTPSEPRPLGEWAGRALLAALLAALPSAIRASGADSSFASAWLVATALWTVPLVPVALLVPRASRGLRGLLGPGPHSDIAAGVAFWGSLSSVGLLLLGGLLHAKTHHRGLGGAAFGIGGAVILLLSAIAAGRLVALGKSLLHGGAGRKWLGLAPWLVTLAALGVLALPLARATGGGLLVRLAMGDGLIGGALLAVALSRELPDAARRALGVLGLPLALLTFAAGGARLETSATGPALVEAGGFPGVTVAVLLAWSDRDGDGHAAHFGGRDCDEGDPSRHPGAVDVAGDGIDSNCDGQEIPAPEPKNDGAPARTATQAATGAPSTSATPPSPSSAASSASSATGAASPAPDSRPDLIVITLDTVRADRTSLHGYSKKTTPVLERLGAEGAVFDHAYSIAGDTQRALTPIMSGHPFSDTPHGAGEWPVIDNSVDTVAERLQRSGYRTGAVTSFTWLRKDRGFAQGFEAFDETPFRENHPERKVTGKRAIDAAIAMHRDLGAGEKPLYLWVHLFDAHARYLPHEGTSFGRDDHALYLGEIAYVDRELGRLVDAVSASSRGKRTMWLVHGSHGEAFDEHGASGHGASLFDEVLHVPMMVSGVGVNPSHVASAASILDIPATVVELAGVEGAGLPGVSLAPVLRGETVTHPPIVAHAYRRAAVVDWPLKLIRTKQKRGKVSLSLYDLSADPAEAHDLARSRPEDVKRLLPLLQAAGGKGDEGASDSSSN